MNTNISGQELSRLLIEEVKKKPSLWNTKDKRYYNKFLAEKEWAQVGATVGVTKNVAKTKWKTLKDAYTRDMKKSKDRKSTGETESGMKAYLESMRFLSGASTSTSVSAPASAEAKKSAATPAAEQTQERQAQDEKDKRATCEYCNSTTGNPPDEDMDFFRSLMPYMKRLPDVNRLSVRREACGALMRELKAAGSGRLLLECAELVLNQEEPPPPVLGPPRPYIPKTERRHQEHEKRTIVGPPEQRKKDTPGIIGCQETDVSGPPEQSQTKNDDIENDKPLASLPPEREDSATLLVEQVKPDRPSTPKPPPFYDAIGY